MKKKDQKGVTLIVLVITIIVLIILAAVSISAIVKKNGTIDNAKYAKAEMERQRREEERLADGELIVGDMEFSSIDQLIEYSGENYGSPHPNQYNTSDVGVGTNGELVNLDLWCYEQARRRMDINRRR